MQRNILITGATDGIGKETARALIAEGACVTIIARNKDKATAVMAEFKSEWPGAQLRFLACDLTSAASIDAAAQKILDSHDRIDVLINNAGGVFMKRAETPDGFEMTFGLNHMAYARLTARLLPRIGQSAPARIVNVASRAHRMARVDWDDLQLRKRYAPTVAYGNSKLFNMWHTFALARRLDPSQVSVNCLHPGVVATKFGRNNGPIASFVSSLTPLFGAITAQDGARTSTYLASAPAVEGQSGGYFAACAVAKCTALAVDQTAQERHWDLTEKLLGFAIV
jgi:NAD(P)-dependent dehydrogenase (short-subunit alcohol dehydrogenase family)